MKPDVSVVVTYCPIDKEETQLLVSCLESLQKTEMSIEIIVETAVNQSYAKTLNKGLEKAQGDYIIVSNNDIIAPNFYAERLINTLDTENCAAVCATEDRAPFLNHEPSERITKGMFGSFWAMPRSTYEKYGGYDERYEPYLFEDTDYWETLQHCGESIYKSNSVHVWHKKASSTSKHAGEAYKDIYAKNHKRFMEKWGFDPIPKYH